MPTAGGNYRACLPQLQDDGEQQFFLGEAGLETTLAFIKGLDMPHFAAFTLVKTDSTREAVVETIKTYVDAAEAAGVGTVLETLTWRASPDWAKKLGYSEDDLAAAIKDSVDATHEACKTYVDKGGVVVISGCVGPRGDGYMADSNMTAAEAQEYHSTLVNHLAASRAVDMISAMTITYPEEAIGIALAAQAAGLPAVISFTTETDGRLPSGHTLKEVIELVDSKAPKAVAYFVVNCAHPTHFEQALEEGASRGEAWVGRIRGVKVNASTKSHAELDDCEELDSGDPEDLGRRVAVLRKRHPCLRVVSGCCGTDERHLKAISAACKYTDLDGSTSRAPAGPDRPFVRWTKRLSRFRALPWTMCMRAAKLCSPRTG